MKFHSVLAVTSLALLSLCAAAQQKSGVETRTVTESAPGAVAVAQVSKVSATVVAIDQPSREVLLKGPKGREFALVAGPDVRNLDQVKAGDKVTVRYVEALSMTLKKNGKELRSNTDTTDAARAAAGQKPGAAVAQQVSVTADVIAVNKAAKTITLRGPKQTVDLKVRDPEQLKLVKVGDQIDAVYTQALALSVEPAARK